MQVQQNMGYEHGNMGFGIWKDTKMINQYYVMKEY